jgi:hypothetical protein
LTTGAVRGDELRKAGKSSTLGFGKVSSSLSTTLNDKKRLLSLRLTFALLLGELVLSEEEDEENIFERGVTGRLFGQFATMCPGSLQ